MLALAAVLVSGCVHATRLESNVTTGALLGGGTGAIIGGLARGTAGGAFAGGVIGALAGGLIGAAVTPATPCYVRTPSGRLRRAWCRGV
jgi:hypothetical protein